MGPFTETMCFFAPLLHRPVHLLGSVFFFFSAGIMGISVLYRRITRGFSIYIYTIYTPVLPFCNMAREAFLSACVI